MTDPGRIALRAASVAEAHIGVKEQGGENNGEMVSRFLAAVHLPPGNAWCCAFVFWCLDQASEELGLVVPGAYPITGWVPQIESWAKRSGNWIPATNTKEKVLRGDLALFYFPAKMRTAHIGIVTAAPEAGEFHTVEGNTSGAVASGAVARNGDGVYAKRRTVAALGGLGGFARLPF